MEAKTYIFWIKSLDHTFKALQRKSLAQKKLKIHAGVKKCHVGNFSEPECYVSTALKNPSLDFKNSKLLKGKVGKGSFS